MTMMMMFGVVVEREVLAISDAVIVAW